MVQIWTSAHSHRVTTSAQTPLDHTSVRATSATVWNWMDVVEVGDCSGFFKGLVTGQKARWNGMKGKQMLC